MDELEQLTGDISVVAFISGRSPSTINRILLTDADFPRPFRMTPKGDRMWLLADVREYLVRKATQATAAKVPEPAQSAKPSKTPRFDHLLTEEPPPRREPA